MNPNEAGQLLLLMQGTWPRLASDEVAARLWVEDLCRCDSRPAMEAFRTLRSSQDRAPSWALFLESYKVNARRFEPERAAIGAPTVLPPTEAEKARVHALVVGLKDRLTRVR